MKPHLPLPLRRAVLSCMTTVALTLACGSYAYAATELPDGSTSLTLTFNEAVAPVLLLSEDTLLVSSEEISALELSDDENSTNSADVTSLVSTVTTVSTDVADTDNSDFTTHLSSGALMLAGAETYTNGSYTRSNETEHLTGSQDFQSYESILFEQNEVTSRYSSTYGGAIYADERSTLTFSGNGDITFSGNTASSSSYAYGGAIYADSTLTFTGNGDITFSGNNSYAYGGAIYADSTLTFSGNGDITFSGNISSAYGGAIYSGSNSTLTIQGSALFEKNTEFNSATYPYRLRLRSIYQSSGSLELSAPTDKSIEFRDSIYSAASTVVFNRDYEKSDGTTQTADGTIRFTGKYTAADLAEMKGGAGTESELSNSLTSTITGTVQLMGGTLSVEDGALLEVGGLTTSSGKNAQIVLKNATLTGGNVVLASDAVLTISGACALLSGTYSGDGAIKMEEVSSLEISDSSIANNISGSGSVLKSTSGSATLTGANSFKGTVTISKGTLKAGSTTAFGTSSNKVTLSGGTMDAGDYAMRNAVNATGGTFIGTNYKNQLNVTGDVTLGENTKTSGIILNSGSLSGGSITNTAISLREGTISSAITGSSAVLKQTTGTATLMGTHTYTGATIVNAGTLIVDDEASILNSTVTAQNGGTLSVKGDIGNVVVQKGGTLDISWYGATLREGQTVTITEGTVQGDLSTSEGGTLNLAGASFSNSLTANGGTICFTSGSSTAVDGMLNLSSETTLVLEGYSVSDTPYTLVQSQMVFGDLENLVSDTRPNYELSTDFMNLYATVKWDTNTTELEWQGGTWTVRGDDEWGQLDGHDDDDLRFYNGDAVSFTTGGEVTIKGTVEPRSISVSGDEDLTFTGEGSIAGSAALSKSGSGTLRIETANSYTGGTTISGGTVEAANADALGSGAVDVKAGSLVVTDGASLNVASLTFAAGTGLTTQGACSLSFGTMTLTQAIANTGTLTLSGNINADALSMQTIALRTDVNGLDGSSGFASSAYAVQIVSGGTVIPDGVTVTHASLPNGSALTLGSNGYATAAISCDYSDYLLTGTDSAKVSAIHAVTGAENATITQTGGTLTADADATTTTTGGSIALTGGTLSGSISGAAITATGGTLAASLSGANSLNAQNWAIDRVLTNSGTLTMSGTIVADALALTSEEATHINTDGQSGDSGFSKSAAYAVTLVEGGTTIDNGVTVTHGHHTLTLGSNGVASEGSVVDYSTYLLTGTDSATVSAIHAVSGAEAASVTQTGGSLTADADAATTTTGGSIALTGGMLSGSISGAAITATGGTLAASLSGANSLNAENWAIDRVLTNSGTLTISGSVDASALDLHTETATHIDTAGNSGASGFAKTAYYAVQLVNGGTTVDNGTTLTHGEHTLTLGSNGLATEGGVVDYDTYHLVDGTVSVSAVHGVSSSAVLAQTGGTLTADADATTTTTGGSIALTGGTLSGSISGASITATGGQLAAALSGANALAAQDWAVGQALSNSGTLTISGSVDASALDLHTEAATHIDTAGNSGASGFAKTAYYAVQLVNGGTTVDNGTTLTHGEHTLTLGSNGLATEGGVVDYDTYHLVDGTVSVSAVHGVSSSAVLAQTGGTLTADADAETTTTGGSIVLTGGTFSGSISGASITATGGQLTAALSGTNTLAAQNWAVEQALSNSGTLTISGSVDASALDLYTEAATHIDTAGNSGDSGFAKTAYYAVQLVNGGTTVDNGTTITHGEHTLTLGSNGLATEGGAIDYSNYLLTGSASASVSGIHAVSGAENTTITQTGGTLTADADATTTTTGGSIALTGGTLSGSISGASITATGGQLTAALSGTNTLAAQNWAVERALSNSGTLTISGSVDASALDLYTEAATHIDTAGNSGDSGFAKTAYYAVQLVNGGTTVDNGTTITHGEHTLTLGSNGLATEGGVVDYDTYHLVDGTVSVSAMHGVSSSAVLAQTGGTLTADADATTTTTGGNIALTGGTLSGSISGASITATGGTLAATISGDNSLNAENWAIDHVLTNSGSLSLSGTIVADALTITSGEITHINTNGQLGDSGFTKSAGYEVKLVEGGTTIDNGVTVTHGQHTLTLGSDGVATDGAIDYSNYLLTESDNAKVSVIHAVSGAEAASVTQMGGTLTVNEDVVLTATGGAQVFQSAAVTGDITSSSLTVTGSSSLDGNLTLSDGASLNLTLSDAALTTPILSLNGTLTTGSLTLNIAGNPTEDEQSYILLRLADASQYDTTKWTKDKITLTGDENRFNYLSWVDGSLVYSNPYKNGIYTRSGQTSPISMPPDYEHYEKIIFDTNQVSSSSSISAGALFARRLTFSDNNCIIFSKNTISGSSALGGAVNVAIALAFTDNGSITFSENTASGSSYYARGGAIAFLMARDTQTFRNNGNITFNGNAASGSSSAYGGAIWADGGSTLTFVGNGDITFSGNTASTTGNYSSSSAQGGAIYASSTLTFSDNRAITFSGNKASRNSTYAAALGGAIYANSLTIQGAALFEKNTEISSDTYQLRSIYQYGGSMELKLSAPTDKSIEFRDSIYSAASTVIFNRDYTKTDGSTQTADGTIRFTGKYTATDLADMKGCEGTASELTNSLTSEITGTVQLIGGTLSVEDGAILNTGGVTISNGATLALQDATLTATGKTITMAEGASITTQGNSTFSFGTFVPMQAIANTGTLTISGNVDVSTLARTVWISETGEVGVSGFAHVEAQTMQLINGGTIVDKGVTITNSSFLCAFKGSLGSDGNITIAEHTDYSNYLLTGTYSASVSAIHAVSGAENATMTQTGGTLTADANATTTTTGGNIALTGGMLSGSINGASITATGGQLSATLSGSNTLAVQNWAVEQALTNSGTLTISGSVDASALDLYTEAATHIDTAGNSGTSGFAKSAAYEVKLVDGGTTIDGGVTVTHGQHTLTLGSDGVATEGGNIDYGNYLLTGSDNATVSVIHAVSGAENATITQTGGTLTADADATTTTTGGSIALTGGTLSGSISGASITATSGQLAASLSGSNTLTAQSWAMSQVLTNSGTLTMSGSIIADALTLNTSIAATHINTNGQSDDSGFAKSADYEVKLVEGGTTIDGGVTVTHGQHSLSLGGDGVATEVGEVDYSNYLLTGTDSANVSAIHAVSGAENATITQTGGALTVDADVTTTTTGGSIVLTGGTLSGNISGASITATGGILAATISGANSLNAENWAIDHVLTNSGSLSLSGTIVADALTITSGEITHINTNGQLGDSGFTKSAGYEVKLVEGGTTINGGVTVTHGQHTLTLGSNGVASEGSVVDYSTYLLTGTDSATVSAIHAVSGAEAAAVTQMGGALTVDADVVLTATGGAQVLQSAGVTGDVTSSSLTVSGANVLNGDLTFQDGATLTFNLADGAQSTALLQLNGTLTTGTLSLNLGNKGHLTSGTTYKLLSLGEAGGYDTTQWTTGQITVSGQNATFGDLTWNNGDLLYTYHSDYSNGTYIYSNTEPIILKNNESFSDYESLTFDGSNVSVDTYSWDRGTFVIKECGLCEYNWQRNGELTFENGNYSGIYVYAEGKSASEYLNVNICNNDVVNFRNQGERAISSTGWTSINICNNGEVGFNNNINPWYDSQDSWSAAAILVWSATVNVTGNDSVVFRGNVARSADFSTYVLRSISSVTEAWGSCVLNLSTNAGQTITFYDSIYADDSTITKLNEGGFGDIIFTGATTEDDLNAALARDGVGRTATAEEITDSRTSYLIGTYQHYNSGSTTLYGGSLRVEDGAVLKMTGLTIAAGAEASLVLKNGTVEVVDIVVPCANKYTLQAEGITLAEGSTLHLSGTGTLNADFTIGSGAQLDLGDGLSGLAYSGSIVLNGGTLKAGNTDITTLNITGSGSVDANLSGDSSFTHTGDGCLVMSGASSYSGGTVIESGTLVAAHAEALGSGEVQVKAAGTLAVNVQELHEQVSLEQNATLAFGSAEDTRGTMTASAANGFTLGAGAVGYDSSTDTANLSGTDESALVLNDILIDMAEGSTLKLENVVLGPDARLTDDTANLLANRVTVKVSESNATLSDAQTMTATGLTVSGHAPIAAGEPGWHPKDGSTLYTLTLSTISNFSISGSSLNFDLSDYSRLAEATSGNYVGIVFESASMDLSTLTVTADINGNSYTAYYDSTQPNGTAYFDLTAATVPEPATATLSLLALAGLAARRRRKGRRHTVSSSCI